ncbi:MAG TPA: NAD-dependent epimerase/dehydratase family protein [Tepidisphaeraceae bacterium]|nr:NAD-dependent epimerase/dehydratase family protein [Tepidisphaeraceae bacterium]
MRILISGAAGFIASHLADLLLAQGHEVLGIDNLLTGRLSNVAHLKHDTRFTLLQQDVTENFKIDGPIDRIYHLASPASPVAYASHRIETMKVNSQGAWNLLDLALEKKARFLVASTSEIYGDPPKNIQREDFWGNVNPIGLRSMYEEAKRFSEACAMAYNRERGADTRIVRIFNTYGPRMHPADGRVVTNFCRQALKHQPITIAGDGTQTRSFCFVSDTVRGLAAVMEADFSEPINIGNPEETPIIQLAKLILELIPESKSKITFEPRADYDPRNRCPDILRAKQILGWSPKIPLKEGLAKVVEYHKRDS